VTLTVLLVALALFCGGWVKGVFGMGLPTVVTNAWQFATGAGASTLALIPVFAGMYAGQLVRLRLHADAYRKWFFIGLIALGVLVIRATLQIVR
jgi:uncharacterized protein